MIFSLLQIKKKFIEQNMPHYIFVDFTTDFDIVNREALWNKKGCPDHFASDLHTGMKA